LVELPVLAALVLAGGAVLSLALCLLFLLAVYVLSGRKKDHLEAGAKALREVRNVGVASTVRAALERRPNRDAGSS
jgi:hypothetical protein